jgi:hypothetical protein
MTLTYLYLYDIVMLFNILYYKNINNNRANNNVEGYNNKLKLYVGAASPNIYKILEIFKSEETSAVKSFRNAIANPPTKPPPRKNYFVNKDDKFRIFKTLYIEKSITLEVYLKHIIELYKFDKNKLKLWEI